MIKKILLICILLGFCSCNTSPKIPFYKKNIVFIFDQDNINEHPDWYLQFERAIGLWSQALPDFNFMTSFSDRSYGVVVNIVDIPDELERLGLYSESGYKPTITLDSSRNNAKIQLVTSLHEIGHSLGLQHFVGKDYKQPSHNWIVVDEPDIETRKRIMYPRLGFAEPIISQLDIDLVRKNF